MTHYRIALPLRRWLAGTLAVIVGLGPLATPAYAAPTPLGDQPLDTQNTAKPNIILTVDDSTSMLNDFLPDYVVSSYCRGGLGGMTATCGNTGASNDFTLVGGGKYFSPGYTYQQFNFPYTNTSTGGGIYGASGPGAGCYPGAPPTCAAGVDPGAPPGIAAYPAGPQPSWPNSGKPYEYWLLWPAPPHSAALNALYYDPRLTYDPPVDSTGASYPQMDSGNTSAWTKVPADPWATTITYVDLTASINVGQWCNSDWTLGLVTNDPTDPNYGKYCRVNGSGAPAFATVSAPQGADYTYPWAPPGFALSTSAGSSTAQSYAAQKVTLDATLTGTAINAANWNASSQNQKFYYENENILWCDPTSPSWPQTGPVQSQFCNNYQAQTCGGAITGTCSNVTPASCNGFVAAACNGFSPAVCNNYQPPQCIGVAGAACNGFTAAACNGVQAAKCNTGPQICNGTPQACNTTPQTCSGPFTQVCNLPGTQTCQPPVCSITYNPPGCNLLPPDPENPCTPVTSCAPPVCTPNPGTCSITGAQCTVQGSDPAECPNQPGACSISGTSCMSAANCAAVGHCSVDGLSCATAANCAIQGGTCSLTGAACNGTTNPCVPAGFCVTPAATMCTSAAQCQVTPGTCNNPPNASCTSAATCPDKLGTCVTPVGQSCSSAAQCSQTPGSGTCSVGGAACTLNTDCPAQNGTCSIGGASCTTSASCPSQNGTCNNPPNASCTSAATCPNVQGTCAYPPATSCSSVAQCSPTPGTCNNPPGLSCTLNSDCTSVAGQCSITHAMCTTPGFDPAHCPSVGTCTITGAECSSNNDCPSQPGPLAPSAATCSTGGVGGVSTATLRNDAENNGVVCRRNNKTAGAYTSGPYAYPSGKFLTPITNGTGADACPATDHYAAVPRHYWKAEVQWCDKKIATAGDQWLGYGTDVGGMCQPGKDSTHIYPRFFQFGNLAYVDNYNTAAFQRVVLDIAKQASATYTHDWTDVNGQPQSITRSFAEEMTNYANWFAYYRTRIQAVKTVTSLTFATLDDQYRVGFHTLSNGLTTAAAQSDPAKFVDVVDFTPGKKAAWFAQLFAVTIPLQLETPTLDAMQRIGEYFSPGGNADLNAAGAHDPITLSCQKNWHMLFTDGFTNQPPPVPLTVPDQDNTVPAVIPVNTSVAGGITVPGLTPGGAWPHPFQEDPNGMAGNAASDYAMNYWVTDLRPSGANATDNVPATSRDPASWQHLNFAAMSLGTQGKLPVANQSLTENQLASGSLQWPQPVPNVWRPDNSGVDDLWHAATNGRGRFVNASTAAELKLGMGQILQDITNQAGSRSGVGLSSDSISGANHAVYRVTFQPGWAGTLAKVNVNPVTGVEDLPPPIWEAATALSNQLTPTAVDPTCATPGSCPWFDNRRIVTVQDKTFPGGGGGAGAAKPFRWDNLSDKQKASLAPGQPIAPSPTVGEAVLEFLRGNPTNEGVSLGQFRVRGVGPNGSEDFLGDIVDSQAVYVGAPNFPYLDANDPGYSAFVATKSARSPMIYVGANDGMLHAFYDLDPPKNPLNLPKGSEAWAFIPHDLYRPDATGLGALAYQDGALPPFRHHFYVDSTPKIYDALFASDGNWHSLLVGGLGKGGNSYYALDVTNPDSVKTEDDVASQYKWTYSDGEMGCTYGRPLIAKTRAFGGIWVAVFAAGYNNGKDPSVCNPNGTGHGEGRIVFIDADKGTFLKEMTTSAGTQDTPSGLAHIAGYTKDFHNQLIEQIYAGDLLGNFWRFDVSCSDDAFWGDGEGSCSAAPPNPGHAALMAQFTDSMGNPQAVTTPPEIDVDVTNGVDRWVFIGTGRLLAQSDLSDPTIANQQQTFYALRDGTTTTPLKITAPLTRSDLVKLDPAAATNERITGLKSKPAKGWYDDLPISPNERIVTPVKAALDVVTYAGRQPQSDPCLTGEPATLYARSFGTGTSLLELGGVAVAGIAEAEGAVGLEVTIFSDSSGPQSASGIDIRIAVTSGNTGDVVFQQVNPPSELAAHRMSWRLLGQ